MRPPYTNHPFRIGQRPTAHELLATEMEAWILANEDTPKSTSGAFDPSGRPYTRRKTDFLTAVHAGL